MCTRRKAGPQCKDLDNSVNNMNDSPYMLCSCWTGLQHCLSARPRCCGGSWRPQPSWLGPWCWRSRRGSSCRAWGANRWPHARLQWRHSVSGLGAASSVSTLLLAWQWRQSLCSEKGGAAAASLLHESGLGAEWELSGNCCREVWEGCVSEACAACEQRGCCVVTHQIVKGGALFIAWWCTWFSACWCPWLCPSWCSRCCHCWYTSYA